MTRGFQEALASVALLAGTLMAVQGQDAHPRVFVSAKLGTNLCYVRALSAGLQSRYGFGARNPHGTGLPDVGKLRS